MAACPDRPSPPEPSGRESGDGEHFHGGCLPAGPAGHAAASWSDRPMGARNGSQRNQPPSELARPAQNVRAAQGLPVRLSPIRMSEDGRKLATPRIPSSPARLAAEIRRAGLHPRWCWRPAADGPAGGGAGVAPPEIGELREITRYRGKLVHIRTSSKDQGPRGAGQARHRGDLPGASSASGISGVYR
jgi:hypothetical protein